MSLSSPTTGPPPDLIPNPDSEYSECSGRLFPCETYC